jgi:hypothetical protein
LAAFTLVSIAVTAAAQEPAGHQAFLHVPGNHGDPDPGRADLHST